MVLKKLESKEMVNQTPEMEIKIGRRLGTLMDPHWLQGHALKSPTGRLLAHFG
jgi:hypothetical protein